MFPSGREAHAPGRRRMYVERISYRSVETWISSSAKSESHVRFQRLASSRAREISLSRTVTFSVAVSCVTSSSPVKSRSRCRILSSLVPSDCSSIHRTAQSHSRPLLDRHRPPTCLMECDEKAAKRAKDCCAVRNASAQHVSQHTQINSSSAAFAETVVLSGI